MAVSSRRLGAGFHIKAPTKGRGDVSEMAVLPTAKRAVLGGLRHPDQPGRGRVPVQAGLPTEQTEHVLAYSCSRDSP